MITSSTTSIARGIERGVWSEDEHDKFLVAIKMYPKGPWKAIAEQIGTRSARQVQTHAQKYYEKVARRVRGLLKDRKKLARPEHRLDEDMATLCKVVESDATVGARIGPIRNGLNAVRSIPKEVFTMNQKSVPPPVAVAVAATTDLPDAAKAEPAPYHQSRRDSIESLLEEEEDDGDDECADATISEFTDSDDSDSLLGFDDEYLGFLVEILGANSCNSDSGSLLV